MSKRILVVDDSASLRHVVKISLEKRGYEVHEGGNGKEAMAKLAAVGRVDLVISDLNMPEMDGLSFVRSMRGLEDFKFTPVVMLTTESGEDRKMEGMEAGVRAWLTKPFQPEQLIGTVSRLIV